GNFIRTDATNIDVTVTNGEIAIFETVGASTGLVVNGASANGDINIQNSGNGLNIDGAVTSIAGDVSLSTGGSITDTGGGNTISGDNIVLSATNDVGVLAGNRLSTQANTINITATNGDVFINEADAVTLTSVSATGAGGAIDIINGGAADITIGGGVAANTTVNINATGSIVDGGGSVSGTDVTLTAGTNVGVSGNAIDTAVDTLAVTAGTGDVFINETDGVTLNASSAGDEINITAAGTIVVAGLVDATTTNTITATGGTSSITNSGGGVVDGTLVTLSAGNDIGTIGGNALGTAADNLNLTATSGDIFISEADNVTIDAATANSAGDEIDISSTGGNIIVGGAISANAVNGDVTLNAAGTLTNTGGSITAGGNADLTGSSIDIGVGSAGTFNFGSLTFNSAGTVAIQENSAMDIAGANTATGLTLVSSGAITDTGTMTIGGTASFDAGATTNDVILDGANDFATVEVVQARNVTFTNETNGIDLGGAGG
ncbi:MAG: hypothetical protein MJA83_06090, partial [Gammaproteobacteria bacterium]|nr:hypothetical protein [Gammaproteobacteria bacterium]